MLYHYSSVILIYDNVTQTKIDLFKNPKNTIMAVWKKKKRQRMPKLTVEDKLCIASIYLREYRTMDSIAAEYGEGTVCLSIQWVEDTLVKNGALTPRVSAPPAPRASRAVKKRGKPL
jgi:hypothetical protein